MAHSAAERTEFGRRLKQLRGTRTLNEVVKFLLQEHGVDTSTAQLSAWERGEYAPRHRGIVADLDAALGGEGQLLAALGYGQSAPDFTGALQQASEGQDPTEVAWASQWYDGLTDEMRQDVHRYLTLQLAVGLEAMKPIWRDDLLTRILELAGQTPGDELRLTRKQLSLSDKAGIGPKPRQRKPKARGEASRDAG